MPIYKYGDRVKIETNGTWKIGTVISVRGNVFSGYTCMVDFDKPPELIPQQMEFQEGWLTPHEDKVQVFGHWLNPNEVCPICREKWHTIDHPIHGKKVIWKDCLKCKKTREELMKEIGK